MSENSGYWGTIATVIPVIALTYATALRLKNWHRLTAPSRRWTALYGAVFVGLLAWSETLSLRHLQMRSSDAFDEGASLLVVTSAALQVLVVPIAPLLVIALHDLHPSVRRAKKKLKETERTFAATRRHYERIDSDLRRAILESKIDGTNRVLRDAALVYEPAGSIRSDYMDRVQEWSAGRDLKAGTDKDRIEIEEELRAIGKDLKRSRKELDKVLRAVTKKTVKVVNWPG